MNTANMWLVVSLNAGLPIFLGAIAVGLFAVHVAVLSNTSWVDDFLRGVPLGSGDESVSATMLTPEAADVAKAVYVMPGQDGAREATIIMPGDTTAKAVPVLRAYV